ncbi:MAG: FtsX-like permease family protein [Firmicutes bacterium]|nr:FtsX-like permease family protein [Bacillota bacterium]
MVKTSFNRDLIRSIIKSRSRFFSVMAIIFLGVCFFAGINATEPDMLLSADKYYKEQRLSDFRIFSPLGFKDEDFAGLHNISDVKTVQKGYYKDLFFTTPVGTTSIVKLMSLQPGNSAEKNGINIPYLTEGRLPKASGEVLLLRGNGVPQELEIGSTVSVTLPNDEEIQDYLITTELTVVGFMKSPLYITFERGQTNIGDGSIAYIAYILEDDFTLESYNEAYVRLQDTDQYMSYSVQYNEMTLTAKNAIEALGKKAMSRETGALRKELEEGKDTFLESKAEAEEELAAAEEQLQQAEQAIVAGEAQLTENEIRHSRELEAGRKKISRGKEELALGKLAYYDGYALWLEGYSRYQDGRDELHEAKVALDEGRIKLEAGEYELEAARSQLEDSQNQLTLLDNIILLLREIEGTLPQADPNLNEEYQELLQTSREIYPEFADGLQSIVGVSHNYVTELRTTLRFAIAELELMYDHGQLQYAEGQKQLIAGEKALVENRMLYENGLLVYQASMQELAVAKDDIDKAKVELDAARVKIEENVEQLEQAEQDIAAAEAKLAASLDEGFQELQVARDKLDKGWATFLEEKEDALAKIDEAEEEITEAERQLLELPTQWFVSTRDGNPGYSGYGDDVERIGAVAKVFPLFFFLVAALVCLTTMTRMIEEERTQIGTMKALGYGTWLIASKYLLYALVASLVGSVLGFSLGFQLFPRTIMTIYGNMYAIPHLLTPFHLDYALISMAIAVLTTVVAALAATLTTLKSTPAQLMQPKAPLPGKRILFERVTFLWERLSFIQKVTVRNLFRYKRRLFMTVIGIAGCCALLLTGFGIRDSVNAIMEKQFNEIFIYDGMVMVDATEDEPVDFEAILGVEPHVTSYNAVMTEAVTVSTDESVRNFKVNLLVPEHERTLSDYFELHQRIGGEHLPLTNEGAVITEKLARLLDVAVGDTLEYRDTENRIYSITISGIAENYLTHYVFMSNEYFGQLTFRDPVYNAGVFNLDYASDYVESQFRQTLMEKDGVIGIALTRSYSQRFSDTLSSLDYVVLILILAAGALAIVVLYNLTNINITERMREIATIKVLGFRDREVSSYVYRENMILSFIGTLFGLLLGSVLHRFVIETMEVDNMMFGREISSINYLIAVLMTLAFTMLVNFFMYYRLKKVDMVESLKSVE